MSKKAVWPNNQNLPFCLTVSSKKTAPLRSSGRNSTFGTRFKINSLMTKTKKPENIESTESYELLMFSKTNQHSSVLACNPDSFDPVLQQKKLKKTVSAQKPAKKMFETLCTEVTRSRQSRRSAGKLSEHNYRQQWSKSQEIKPKSSCLSRMKQKSTRHVHLTNRSQQHSGFAELLSGPLTATRKQIHSKEQGLFRNGQLKTIFSRTSNSLSLHKFMREIGGTRRSKRPNRTFFDQPHCAPWNIDQPYFTSNDDEA